MQVSILGFWQKQFKDWIEDYKGLLESILVAVSLQIALLPILWFIGWALPWPKPPIFTTIIEYELDSAQSMFKPKDVVKYRDPKLNP